MAKQVCYVIPGFLGSKLVYPDVTILGDTTMWFRPWSFSTSVLGLLRLPDNMGNDDESPIREGGVWEAFYGTLLRWLVPRFDRVVGLGYDFRRAVTTSASNVVARIGNDLEPGESATIVAHSMGGLVAAASLIAGGHSLQQRFRNFITLGTPWGGSLRMVEALCGRGQSMITARLASRGINGGQFGLTDYFMRSLLATWSGSYDLLPPKSLFDPKVAAGVPDHNSADAWAAAGKPVSAARLAKSVIDREANRRVPPGVVHTNIIGIGQECLAASRAEKIGEGSYDGITDGDNIVSADSATAFLGSASHVVEVREAHTALAWSADSFTAIEAAINN